MPNEWPTDGLEFLGSCPVCFGSRRVILFDGIFDRINSAPGYWSLHQCLECGAGYLDPRPTQAKIGIAYQTYYTHQTAPLPSTSTHAGLARRLRNGYLNHKYGSRLMPQSDMGAIFLPLIPTLKARAHHLFRHLPPISHYSKRPRLLEIGCGNGHFLAQMASLGWEVLGVEPDLKAVLAARELGVEVLHGALEDFDLPADGFDAISMHHVIEHLHHPTETLLRCRQLLIKGGVLSVITPNLSSLSRRVYRSDWYALHPPCHLVLFTTTSLVSALRQVGFHAVKTHASSYSYSSVFRASKGLQPSLRRPSGLERYFASTLMGSLAALSPYLSEEATVTAVA